MTRAGDGRHELADFRISEAEWPTDDGPKPATVGVAAVPIPANRVAIVEFLHELHGEAPEERIVAKEPVPPPWKRGEGLRPIQEGVTKKPYPPGTGRLPTPPPPPPPKRPG